jgi:hypothetical protein
MLLRCQGKCIAYTDLFQFTCIVFFFFSFSGWGGAESTWYVGHCWPNVPAPDDRWWWLWSSPWNEDWQGKPKYSEKNCPSATLSTTNPTWLACITVLAFFINIQPFFIPSYMQLLASLGFWERFESFKDYKIINANKRWNTSIEFAIVNCSHVLADLCVHITQTAILKITRELLLGEFGRARGHWRRRQINVCSTIFWKMPLVSSPAKEVSFFKNVKPFNFTPQHETKVA